MNKVPKHKTGKKKNRRVGKGGRAQKHLKDLLKNVNLTVADVPKMPKIPNKDKRAEVFARRKKAKNVIKSQQRQKRKREEELLGDKAPPKKVPKTIESMRVPDVTFVQKEDEEVIEDTKTDEFADYFDGKLPKILITTSRRASPVCISHSFPFLNFF